MNLIKGNLNNLLIPEIKFQASRKISLDPQITTNKSKKQYEDFLMPVLICQKHPHILKSNP
jgi:hypothetical protein